MRERMPWSGSARAGVVTEALAVCAMALWSTGAAESADGSLENPVASTLEEQVESRLVQIDVPVDGDPDAVGSLTREDFALTVGGKQINEVVPMTIAETEDPCVQVVDVLKAGRLRRPVVDYRVTARIGNEIVAQDRRALRVGATEEPRCICRCESGG